MARACICPVCSKPAPPEQLVYAISEEAYHPECYEKREAERAESEGDPSRD